MTQRRTFLTVQSVVLTSVLLLILTSNVHALGAYPLDDPAESKIGLDKSYTIQDKETLIELAREYRTGFNEIADANSRIDPWVPRKGDNVIIPASWLLPDQRDDGIVINLAEMRLYYFFTIEGNKYVMTCPIGIGREGFNTPPGDYTITFKVKDPIWHVPEDIRKEKPELPEFVLPGPENPLGGYWMQLSIKGYGIHGTNRPYGIGRRVSHGCIRLYPEDIEGLFQYVNPGTKVQIIDEPVKAGMSHGRVYIEVHRSERNESELMKFAVMELSRKRLLNNTDTELLMHAIMSATGLPAEISK